MKRAFLHFKRVISKLWFILVLFGVISPIVLFGMAILMTIVSMMFFDDPVDPESAVEDILNNFTEEQLNIIFSEKVDEDVCDDDYLTLLARYQSYVCPKKLDYITVWDGSELTNDSYVYLYTVNDKKFDYLDLSKQKDCIRTQINKNSVQTKRVISSGRNMVFRYTYKNSAQVEDVVFSNKELKEL